ncbi:MAG: SprT family zinc-dependent metalloprotease [Bacteroidota bacterium]|nr:SprT family zinc-dependent metalloprotease [Bacteroidota bacterium]
MTQAIQFGSKNIDYSVSFSNRKTLGITVTPEMEILVKAPYTTSSDKIKEKVRKKAPWILKQLSYFLSFEPKTPPRKYVGGESHLYLGRQYRLKVTLAKRNEVKYKGRYIEVYLKGKIKSSGKVKELMEACYRMRAKVKFAEIAEPLIQKFKKYGIEPTNLFIREMPKRWGSCTPKGKIILNPELIKAPKPCIEYVIVHELCHLKYHDHTRKFFELQSKEMPDWEKWKEKLERVLA